MEEALSHGLTTLEAETAVREWETSSPNTKLKDFLIENNWISPHTDEDIGNSSVNVKKQPTLNIGEHGSPHSPHQGNVTNMKLQNDNTEEMLDYNADLGHVQAHDESEKSEFESVVKGNTHELKSSDSTSHVETKVSPKILKLRSDNRGQPRKKLYETEQIHGDKNNNNNTTSNGSNIDNLKDYIKKNSVISPESRKETLPTSALKKSNGERDKTSQLNVSKKQSNLKPPIVINNANGTKHRNTNGNNSSKLAFESKGEEKKKSLTTVTSTQRSNNNNIDTTRSPTSRIQKKPLSNSSPSTSEKSRLDKYLSQHAETAKEDILDHVSNVNKNRLGSYFVIVPQTHLSGDLSSFGKNPKNLIIHKTTKDFTSLSGQKFVLNNGKTLVGQLPGSNTKFEITPLSDQVDRRYPDNVNVYTIPSEIRKVS